MNLLVFFDKYYTWNIKITYFTYLINLPQYIYTMSILVPENTRPDFSKYIDQNKLRSMLQNDIWSDQDHKNYALSVATYSCQYTTMDILLQHGANPMGHFSDSVPLLEVAMYHNDKPAIDILMTYMLTPEILNIIKSCPKIYTQYARFNLIKKSTSVQYS